MCLTTCNCCILRSLQGLIHNRFVLETSLVWNRDSSLVTVLINYYCRPGPDLRDTCRHKIMSSSCWQRKQSLAGRHHLWAVQKEPCLILPHTLHVNGLPGNVLSAWYWTRVANTSNLHVGQWYGWMLRSVERTYQAEQIQLIRPKTFSSGWMW